LLSILLKSLRAVIFLITSGAVFSKYFKQQKFLIFFASVIAVVSGFYLVEGIYSDFKPIKKISLDNIEINASFIEKINNLTLLRLAVSANGMNGVIDYADESNVKRIELVRKNESVQHEWIVDDKNVKMMCDAVCYPNHDSINPYDYAYDKSPSYKNCKFTLYKYDDKLLFVLNTYSCDADLLTKKNVMLKGFDDEYVYYQDKTSKKNFKHKLPSDNRYRWYLDNEEIKVFCVHGFCKPFDERLGDLLYGYWLSNAGCAMEILKYINKYEFKIKGSACNSTY